MALRTRSRLSRTLASGRPTMVNAGQAKRHVHLDVDGTGLDAEDGGGPKAREHAPFRVQAPPHAASRLFSTTYGRGTG